MGARRVGEPKAEYIIRHAQEQKEWCARHPGRNGAIAKKSRLKHPKRTLLRFAKIRAEQDGVPFDLTETDITIPEFCPLLGIRLQVGAGGDSALSLDKIIPSLGYVRGNSWVISNKANRMKNDATIKDLQYFARAILKKWPDADQK